MKLLKTLSIAAAVAALANSAASAATAVTVLHVAGSTAFRSSASLAIMAALGETINNSGAAPTGPVTFTSDKGSYPGVLGANYSTFYNSSTGVAVECFWTGSLSGVTDLVGRPNLNFVSYTDSTMSSTGGKATSGSTHDSAPPDVAFSDSYYSSVEAILKTASLVNPSNPVGTQTFANTTALANTIDSSTPKDINGAPVGIVAFEWIAGNITGTTAYTGSATWSTNTVKPPFSNITATVARNLVATGFVPISIIPGNTDSAGTPAADLVFLVGRSEDSGTRIDTFANTGVGLTPTSVKQHSLAFDNVYSTSTDNTTVRPTGGYSGASYSSSTGTLLVGQAVQNGGISTVDTSGSAGSGSTIITTSGGSATAYAASTSGLFPADPLNTETNITWNSAGHAGYIAGGDVANVLSAYANPAAIYLSDAPGADSTGSFYLVGYVGLSDATGVAYGTPLSYEGTSPIDSTHTPTEVLNGQYPIFSEEHMYYLSAGTFALNSTLLSLAQSIGTQITTNYAASDKYGNFAVKGSPTAYNTVVSPSYAAIPGEFDGSGLYYGDMAATTSGDGGAYNLTY